MCIRDRSTWVNMKDIPLTEITLRKYEKPANLEKRELIRKICLSLGLLQLGDSRDIIVDILMVLVEANKNKEEITSDEINLRVGEIRKKYSLETKGLAESNIRRQLKRLRDKTVSYTHLRAHETRHDLVCRLLLEKKKTRTIKKTTSHLRQNERVLSLSVDV
eukprot:TRINITY_DN15042_c0_g1_i1.p1 TRINITY_DN15042_c0_g1~~TRINITY_DN15042_c0_g1_i1.p1  ORF type:complete len:162 (+),score=20.03 TRINITY_DN15042_c0_g1_i1:144-629(+)